MTICTLLLVALCSFNALAAPIETKTPDISKRDDVNATYRLSGYEGCNAYQIGSIKDGYSDFTYMIDSTGGVFPKYKPFDWNSAVAQDFWGPADRNRLYRAQIKGNLDRLAAVTYDFWLNPFARTIHVRCDDPEDYCSPPECALDGSVVSAYTIDHKPHINFCGGYFRQKSLADAMMADKAWDRATGYYNKASTWAHELMHVEDIGHVADGALRNGIADHPVQHWAERAGQKAYGAASTKWIAQDPAGIYWDAVENADNYAYFVTMNFAQKTKGYYQSVPQIQISPKDEVYSIQGTLEGEVESGGEDNRCVWV